MKNLWRFYIDRGGTFTDVIAIDPHQNIITKKMLSKNLSSQHGYEDAIVPIIKSFFINSQSPYLDGKSIEEIRIGTTIGTNALLEKKGKSPVLIITRGFKDILKIGYQNRPELFRIEIQKSEPLYKKVIEVEERIDSKGNIILPVNWESLEKKLKKIRSDSYVVVLLHSYRNPVHEKKIRDYIYRFQPDAHVLISSEVSPHPKIVKRGYTAVLDAYLNPILKNYIQQIQRAFRPKPKIFFMKSDGILVEPEFFSGKDSILSGPAGGIIASSFLGKLKKEDSIIGFDMGGTSTDVFFYDVKNQHFDFTEETVIANTEIHLPMLNIYSVASGGGSILKFDEKKLSVGPESAGAYPGPLSYRNAGPLTITDANLLLGRIQRDFFPKIFGKDQSQPLDLESVIQEFRHYYKNKQFHRNFDSIEDLAEGFLNIAIENMSSAIRKISIEKGYNILKSALISFGGAGGQVACKLAESLGIRKVIFPYFAGVFSALGLAITSKGLISKEIPIRKKLSEKELQRIKQKIQSMIKSKSKDFELHIRIFVRYVNSDYNIDIPFSLEFSYKTLKQKIKNEFIKRFGFFEAKELWIDYIYLTLNEKNTNPELIRSILKKNVQLESKREPIDYKKVYIDRKWYRCPIYSRDFIHLEVTYKGPCMFVSSIDTTLIFPNWHAYFDEYGNLICERKEKKQNIWTSFQKKKIHPVLLEIIQNRFQNIAEQMGVVLQKTAFSVNIKERLDFSCAIFDSEGNLISNAPHIPVHLGSMSESVKAIIRHFFSSNISITEKDSFIMNDPYQGGTHLPDITVITPYFYKKRLLFFLASRGHHSDVGGIMPGSMPATSKKIQEEGVLIPPMFLIRKNRLNPQLIRLFNESEFPVRNIDQNLFDLKAQLSANYKGIQLLDILIQEFSEDIILRYYRYILDYSEWKIRQLLQILKPYHGKEISLTLDYGETLKVQFREDPKRRKWIFDFSGTTSTQYNLNTPISVTKSAVLFFLRSLLEWYQSNVSIKENIPLNDGCLRPVEIIVPDHSLLKPLYPSPVAGGNVEISQKIVDLLCGLFEICASSQGSMNNITFGNHEFQYYETLCGGSGAGRRIDNTYFVGCDAVHTHMTNSRITDIEIIEERFPVRIQEFSIRERNPLAEKEISGGRGVIRSFLFLKDCKLSLLTSNRKTKNKQTSPFGISGGSSGKPGENILIRNHKKIILEPICEVDIIPGDILMIKTPNGGNIKIQ